MSILDYEDHLMRQLNDLRTSENPAYQALYTRLLKGQAEQRARASKHRMDSERGAALRRAAGDHKAQLVDDAVAKGIDPLTLVSERQLRRIRTRKKK